MPNYKVLLSAIGAGLFYGLAARFIFGLDPDEMGLSYFHDIFAVGYVMSIAFLFLVPYAAGFITGYLAKEKASVVYYIFAPWITTMLVIFFSFIFALEGLICVFMALPVFLLAGTLGGLTAYAVVKSDKNRFNTLVFCSVIFLPFLAMPIENNIEREKEIIDISTTVFIQSDEKSVWDNIVKVYEIKEEENGNTLFLMMGFPRPIKAELDKEGIGGVRKAIFDRGLIFTETVTQWDPMKSFTFTIEADPNSIPPEALDEHVTVGGEYFDVLEGKYEIEPVDGGVNLHLTSKFRMSTNFNFYSRIWCKAIMGDIQDNILHVVKNRCEK